MGKLHTLRRAIERNPKDWLIVRTYGYGAKARTMTFAAPAYFDRKSGQWVPTNRLLPWYGPSPYLSFVASVLRELGYPTIKPISR